MLILCLFFILLIISSNKLIKFKYINKDLYYNNNYNFNLFINLLSLILLYCIYLIYNVFYIDLLEHQLILFNSYIKINTLNIFIVQFYIIITTIVFICCHNPYEYIYNKNILNNINNLKLNYELELINSENSNYELKLLNNANNKLNNINTLYNDELNNNLINKYYNSAKNIIYNNNKDLNNNSYIINNLNSYRKSLYDKPNIEFYIIILFTIISGIILILSNDLIIVYITIELQSFSLYIISCYYKDSKYSVKAGLKYFLLGGLSSCLLLLGIVCLYSLLGTTNFELIYISLFNIQSSDYIFKLINISLLLIIIGFLFKIAVVPFHNWAVDVYDNVPTNITLILNVLPKIIYIPLLYNILSLLPQHLLNINILNNTINILLILYISIVLSLFIGSLLGLIQYKLKRLLTYSTINNVGLILMGLLINNNNSLNSLLIYLVIYSLISITLFIILITESYNNNNINNINSNINKEGYSNINTLYDLRNIGNNNLSIAFAFVITIFSLIGIPPFYGFFSKFYIFTTTLISGYNYIILISIITIIISSIYYLNIIENIYLNYKNNNVNINYKNNKFTNLILNVENNIITDYYININSIVSLIIALLTLLNIIFIIESNIFFNIVHIIGITIMN